MKRGELSARIKLHKIKTPQGPHHIFNPTHEDVTLIQEVWAKREDNPTPSRWAMVTQNTITRVQFIINYREDLPEDLAVEHRGQIYPVLGRAELGQDKKWTILLAGRLGESGHKSEVFGL